MFEKARIHFETALTEIRKAGLEKHERVLKTAQGAHVRAEPGGEVVNLCANNYLGLANDPRVVEAAIRTLESFGYGLSSVRFIVGTQSLHKELEQALSRYLGTDDTILYSSCFDANGGLFETILTEDDAIISDELNHASIIDGIRLSKAVRLRYKNGDMGELEAHLKAAQGHRMRLIATDGVFSMDGCFAKLGEICDLADRYNALVMVDDSHATGFIGPTGRGTPELFGVLDRVDIITSTLGKTLGGASGGFTSGRREIIDLLRQRSRPYLFSNSLAPAICGASLEVLKILDESAELRTNLVTNMTFFRSAMIAAGFTIQPGSHPIIPIMLHDAERAQALAEGVLAEGIYVVGFWYPVVPKDKARIRVQISAAHTRQDLERAVAAFKKVGSALRIID